MAQGNDDFSNLVRRVREGSEEAAWEMVEQYGDAIRRAVRRALHERLRSKFDSLDFVQIVWNSLFQARDKLSGFDRPAELVAYLIAMARNKVGMEVRRRLMTTTRGVQNEESLEQLPGKDEIIGPEPEPVDVAIAREQWNRLLDRQPPRDRQIVCLRLQGYTYQHIAETLQVDKCTVRRVLKKLLRTTAA
jgi:RNA polymerase sigma factor (sigma-70 family)